MDGLGGWMDGRYPHENRTNEKRNTHREAYEHIHMASERILIISALIIQYSSPAIIIQTHP
jgi:hypothetical protein